MNNEQKIEKTKVIVEEYFYGEVYRCPSCREHLGYDYEHNFLEDVNFCWKCGQPLDWEGTMAKDMW